MTVLLDNTSTVTKAASFALDHAKPANLPLNAWAAQPTDTLPTLREFALQPVEMVLYLEIRLVIPASATHQDALTAESNRIGVAQDSPLFAPQIDQLPLPLPLQLLLLYHLLPIMPQAVASAISLLFTNQEPPQSTQTTYSSRSRQTQPSPSTIPPTCKIS